MQSAEARPDYDLILERLDRQDRRLSEQDRRLAEQQREIERLREALADGDGPRTAVFTPPDPGEEGSGLRFVQDEEPVAPVAPGGAEGEGPVAPAQPREEGEQPLTGAEARPEAERPTEQLLVERGGVLLPQGTLQIEPSFEYEHSSRDRVAINGFTIFDAIIIGSIRVDDLERDILTAALTTRYGITNRLQAEVRVPYVYRSDQEILGVGTNDERTREIDNYDLGDIEANLSYQVLSQRDWIPATILRAEARFPTGKDPFEIERVQVGPDSQRLTEPPTGSGFYGVGPSATFVWRLDPAVAFSGVGYTFNLTKEFSEFGEIDPGDTFEWFVGTNIALSELVSLNLSFVNQITFKTEQEGRETPGSDSNDARLVLGSSIGLSERMSLVASAGAGLTEDSPDFNFTVSVPISLQVFD
ncbi:hypothetical protein [Ferruginivarius sediminum]|uniref:Transporter n=1 Tax=Ferruginivarius sediminum TaxID=2661937 RepID=A0A369TEW3_9PROT|nr:hypothetical protein [Ferruginivarius sediminum]RDD62657.1 hypothetical protein DRB17_05710 [Ferruginivarius sediminum]